MEVGAVDEEAHGAAAHQVGLPVFHDDAGQVPQHVLERGDALALDFLIVYCLLRPGLEDVLGHLWLVGSHHHLLQQVLYNSTSRRHFDTDSV